MKLSRRRMLVAFGVAAAAVVPAHATDKRDFEACDGRIHPGKQDDGMRGEASRSGYLSTFGLYNTPNSGVVPACTRALASPRLLSTQILRKAHLLRARAAAHLKAGDTAQAIADLDLAEAATAGLSGDRFFKRSMGVSMLLLRALAYAQSKDLGSAAPLARAAMDARPYSLQVQQAGARILQAARPVGDVSPSPFASLLPLEPAAAATALINEAEIGNFASVIKMRPQVTVNWPTEPMNQYALLGRDPQAMHMISGMLVSLHTAYALAAIGDAAGARRDLADVREKVASLIATPSEGAGVATPSPAKTAIDSFIEMRARQIDARIATAEGRTGDAIAALVGAPMPRDAATVELLTALKAAVPAKDSSLIPDSTPFLNDFSEVRRKELAEIVPTVLIAPETTRAVVDYERARPNILGALIGGALTMGTSLLGGIDRTDGFRSKINADGTTNVEFIGNTPSAAMVQEMTLLRAAELARTAGKPAFVVVDRKDFTRTMRTTRNGMEISSAPTGFKTELAVRFVDAGVDTERALDTVKVIDALGPLYYEEKKTGG